MMYRVEPYTEIDHKLYVDQADVFSYLEEDEAKHQAKQLLLNPNNDVQRVMIWHCIFDEQAE